MIIRERRFFVNDINYMIRSAVQNDADELSDLRLRMDGETEHLDREPGEAFLDASAFGSLIRTDSESPRNLFLVAVVDKRIVGFSRCEGSPLKRFSHKVEFGVSVRKDYWGCGIGKNLLRESIAWADANGIQKMALHVLETNDKAIRLYQRHGFEVEGILRRDKILSDGNGYNTILMGRFAEGSDDQASSGLNWPIPK